MTNLYHFLFKLLLILPALGIINSAFLNKHFKTQKTLNNIIYIAMVLVGSYVLLLFTAYKSYDFTLFEISKNIPIVFSVNSINIIFFFFLSIIILFINLVFQNYFPYLNLNDKYPIYNQQIACLYFISVLLAFSHSIVITIFLYSLALMFSFFLITNPDLKELRKNYSHSFSITMIANMTFLFLAGYYFLNDGVSLFIPRSVHSVETIYNYWLLFIMFSLVLVNLCGTIYMIFRIRFYYEDFLPIAIILLFPFIMLNTFVFTKVTYYVFYNNFNSIAPYLFYSQFLMIALFILACFFTGKYIKDGLKFNSLFIIANFLIFFSQMLFINAETELITAYSNFLIFLLAAVVSILGYSGLLAFLLKSDTTSTNLIYRRSKIEINFYLFCLFMPILANTISFFSLNFHNFNFMYLVNAAEIFIIFVIYLVYVFFAVVKKPKLDAKQPTELPSNDVLKMFLPQIVLLLVFLLMLLMGSQIVKFIVFYK